ncbi:hypothetical protein HNR23_004255 [Nocardiopsis mwathae]|uniref:Uncharacterized protein n=1 Tax=Nocardiopsis mwathae TaxID=1472723 RepID=A0A7W9YLI1_9ACTN|nr:hypothetical protein [Nocardiopsis mwathae]MBB6174195.1 hypothetical protein [Nocardiopsis mwathae]
MSQSHARIYALHADEIGLSRLPDGDLSGLRIADAVIVLDDAFLLARQDRIHALERLAELARQAAGELRTGRRDDEAEVDRR